MDLTVIFQVLVAAVHFTMVPFRSAVASASLVLSALAAPSWHKYVRSPNSHTVHPVAIVANSVTGNVSNPDGLLHGRPTVLTREASQGPPSLVLDFGQNVVGLLEVTFGHSKSFGKGLPGVKLAFSETLEFLGDSSDFTRSDNASGVCNAHSLNGGRS